MDQRFYWEYDPVFTQYANLFFRNGHVDHLTNFLDDESYITFGSDQRFSVDARGEKPVIKIYLRLDTYEDFSQAHYKSYFNVMGEIGGLAVFIYRPLVVILGFFTTQAFTGKIIEELF